MVPAAGPWIRSKNWYCLVAIGFTAMVITSFAVLLVKSDGEICVSTSSKKSPIIETGSWLAAILLFVCIASMEVVQVNSTTRNIAKFFALALITMLVTMFCAKLDEFFPLPVMCIAWFMVASNSIEAWCAFFLR